MVFSRGSGGSLAPSWVGRPRPLTLHSDRQGLYSYDPDAQNLFPRKKAYSFWSAVKYILILSLMLWWIPTFGQMIAGYVGGRKAGNHWVAALAAFFPVAIIWTLSLIVQAMGVHPELANLIALPASLAYAIGDAIPIFEATIRFLVAYVTSFAMALRETVSMGMNGYLVTIIFAYIGGLIADQALRERKVEAESEEAQLALPPAIPSYQPIQYLPVRSRLPLVAGPTGWYTAYKDRYDHLRRIPVSPYGYEEEPSEVYEYPTRRPAQRRVDEVYPPEEVYRRPHREPYRRPTREPYRKPYREPYREREVQEPPPPGPRTLGREELIKRLVERALREYDRSIR